MYSTAELSTDSITKLVDTYTTEDGIIVNTFAPDINIKLREKFDTQMKKRISNLIKETK